MKRTTIALYVLLLVGFTLGLVGLTIAKHDWIHTKTQIFLTSFRSAQSDRDATHSFQVKSPEGFSDENQMKSVALNFQHDPRATYSVIMRAAELNLAPQAVVLYEDLLTPLTQSFREPKPLMV